MKDTKNVEEGTKQINSIELYYKILGKGKTLVILHGGPGMNHTYLLPHLNILAENYRLIFYDQRACGHSTGNIDSESLTVYNFVKDLEGIREAFNLDTMNLMGHSWGGFLAMSYGVTYPNKVNSLILVDSALFTSEVYMKQNTNRETRMTDEDRILLEKVVQSEGCADGTPRVAELIKILERVNFYDRSLANSFSLTLNGKTAKNALVINKVMRKSILDCDIHNALSRIGCPTLIIHGDYDTVPLEAAQEIHQCIAGSQLVVLQNCGHYPFIESPTEFCRAVSIFLDNL